MRLRPQHRESQVHLCQNRHPRRNHRVRRQRQLYRLKPWTQPRHLLHLLRRRAGMYFVRLAIFSSGSSAADNAENLISCDTMRGLWRLVCALGASSTHNQQQPLESEVFLCRFPPRRCDRVWLSSSRTTFTWSSRWSTARPEISARSFRPSCVISVPAPCLSSASVHPIPSIASSSTK